MQRGAERCPRCGCPALGVPVPHSGAVSGCALQSVPNEADGGHWGKEGIKGGGCGALSITGFLPSASIPCHAAPPARGEP